MIIENGTIEFKLKVPSPIDPETGLLKPAAKTAWSDPIPCQIIPNTQNLRGRVNGGHFTVASFVVLLEEQRLPASEQVRLAWSDCKTIGEYSLIAPPELLQAVCEIKLMV